MPGKKARPPQGTNGPQTHEHGAQNRCVSNSASGRRRRKFKFICSTLILNTYFVPGMERNIRTLGTETRRCFSDLGIFLRFQKRPRVSLRQPLVGVSLCGKLPLVECRTVRSYVCVCVQHEVLYVSACMKKGFMRAKPLEYRCSVLVLLE